ncbi:beta-1,4-mannosyltransferase [Lentinus brumalis]|uniref:Chitobiosyldiphosphodolichol beta-mannosyltransferase n=1 Tax=Lentinus brumalis TaxID=2498619 RepID=A0A371DG16_9APHY|nr:beta-1,4-mannosyltransferase [Polyporus brumalis]
MAGKCPSGSTPIPSLLSTPLVKILHLSEPPRFLTKLPFVIGGPLKVVRQVLDIVYTLAVRIPHPPEFILVQNPPSIPTLAIVWFVSKMRGCKVIIDWHNTGYSILALRLGWHHPFIRIAKWFEGYFGKCAYAHLCVSKAMLTFLVSEFDIQGQKVVLYDRPPAHFGRASASQTHELFQHLLPALSAPAAGLTSFLPASKAPYSTPFTYIPPLSPDAAPEVDRHLGSFTENIAMPTLRPDRPALIVSSTSWTPDEDFGVLLDALKDYERRARKYESRPEDQRLPKILVIITGKGPLREKYMREVEQLQTGHGGALEGAEGPWRYVRCVSLWLEASDYPLLLGSANIGISLHWSSSGYDLPMKIVDMFGCGLPVLAREYPCLKELVREGVNGYEFLDSKKLADLLLDLLRGFPQARHLSQLRQKLNCSLPGASRDEGQNADDNFDDDEDDDNYYPRKKKPEPWEWSNWEENWNRIMRPLLLHDVASEAAL